MPAALPWDDGHGDTKGWDRASIANRSAKPYRPDVTASDLRLPDEAGHLRALALCFVCALGATFLYVVIPLYVVQLFAHFGVWLASIPLVSVVGLTILFFVYSTYETRSLRELAHDL
jgi:hypothetical protein